jgi:hypothetical protein
VNISHWIEILNNYYLKDNLDKYEVVNMMMNNMIHLHFDQLNINKTKIKFTFQIIFFLNKKFLFFLHFFENKVYFYHRINKK